MRGNEFLIFSENFQKISTENAQIWIFLKNFKCEVIFLSSSLDSLLSPTTRDVFTGFVSQSVSGVMADHNFCAKILARARFKEFLIDWINSMTVHLPI